MDRSTRSSVSAHHDDLRSIAPPRIPEQTTAIRVLLIGPHTIVRAALASLIGGHSRMRVVADAALAMAGVLVEEHRPDVLIVMINDGWQEALDQLPTLLQVSPRTAVLLLTSAHANRAEQRAIALGVRGVLLLEEPTAVLLNAIEKVHAGELWRDRSRADGLVQQVTRAHTDPVQAKIASLTRRELEILRLIGEGLRSAQIADRLFISQATVKNHVTSILAKLELSDSFDIAVFAYRHGLVRFE
jgi:DNA-binding NarL/FixJ family response regulator